MATFAPSGGDEPANAEAYLDKMIRLMRSDGVRFPDNKVPKFARWSRWGTACSTRTANRGDAARRVAVTFGPQYGPITAKQVEECLREAYRRGYDDLVFAASPSTVRPRRRSRTIPTRASAVTWPTSGRT